MFKKNLEKKYISLYGREFLRECTKPLRRSIRVNTLLSDDATVKKRLKKQRFELRKGFANNSFVIERERFKIGSTIEHLSGLFFVQELTSMVPSEWLKPSKKDFVLDAFCSPGGKTTHLASIMENNGKIIALDSDIRKNKAMVQNLDRMNIINTDFFNLNSKKVNELGLTFDKALLDMPCSGSGIIHKDFRIVNRLSEDLIKSYASKQKELFEKILPIIKEGGRIVYSVCSVNPEETFEITDFIIKEFGVTKIKDKQYLPHKDGTAGFYSCLLKK